MFWAWSSGAAGVLGRLVGSSSLLWSCKGPQVNTRLSLSLIRAWYLPLLVLLTPGYLLAILRGGEATTVACGGGANARGAATATGVTFLFGMGAEPFVAKPWISVDKRQQQ